MTRLTTDQQAVLQTKLDASKAAAIANNQAQAALTTAQQVLADATTAAAAADQAETAADADFLATVEADFAPPPPA